jgi:hypothetical protein
MSRIAFDLVFAFSGAASDRGRVRAASALDQIEALDGHEQPSPYSGAENSALMPPPATEICLNRRIRMP